MSSVAKVIEIIGESEEGFDDALRNGCELASRSVDNIQSLWVDNQTAIVEDGEITTYRVNAKVTFVVDSETAGSTA